MTVICSKEVLARLSIRRKIDSGKPLEELVKKPELFVIEYRDGLRASILTLNGAVGRMGRRVAIRRRHPTRGRVGPVLAAGGAALLRVHSPARRGPETIRDRANPPGRSNGPSLTSGALDAVLISKRDGGDWLKTSLPRREIHFRLRLVPTTPRPARTTDAGEVSNDFATTMKTLTPRQHSLSF